MTKSRLFIGQKITVSHAAGGESYYSMIQDLDNHTLAITVPMKKGRPLLLYKGDQISIQFVQHDAVYSFVTEVKGQKKVNYVNLFIVQRPKTFSRYQQREHVRLNIVLPLRFMPLPKDSEEETPARWYKGKTVDISGGGLQFSTSKRSLSLQREDMLAVRLSLEADDEEDTMEIKGVVTRIENDDIKGGFRIALRFTEIKEADREKTIGFIFREMRKRIISMSEEQGE